MDSNSRFIIVIGASAGGLNAMNEVVSQLPDDINASVFIVLHLSKIGLGDFLVHRLQKYTTYTCSVAKHGEKIQSKHIYLAPPDQHLLVKDDEIILALGPSENRWRPSIDVLFRSAAAAYSDRVIGIILTGLLNDGTAGMDAIKRSGGHTIVQDPNEAEYPDMPLAVLENLDVNYCVPLNNIGEAILALANNAEVKGEPAPKDVIAEAQIAEQVVISIDAVSKLGSKSLYSCPDCGGGLWSIDGETLARYRCHIGHSYTEQDLLIKQEESLESTLWIALRMMEERRNLLLKISRDETSKGLKRLSLDHQKRAEELERHIEKLKSLLFSSHED
jgi:two-component system chemotaxis response regulator CheB